MRTRFPLFAKILGWLFLNLALLAAIGLIFAQQKLRFGLDALVSGPAGDRLRAVGVLMLDEMKERPRVEWNEVLRRFSAEYGVRFYLFAERGTQLAGDSCVLPRQVSDRIRDPGGRPPPRDQPPRPNDSLGPPRDEPPPRQPAPHVMALQRAGEPPRYWVLMHAPLPQLGPEGPAVFVLESRSLSAGGLIFDPRPLLWVVGGVVVLSVLFWLPLVRGITRSIAAIRNATTRIAAGHFDTRIETRRRDELGELGTAINTMSERLASLLHGQRRFLGDVAHELCAPLSRLQLALGILEDRASASDSEKLRDVREEVDQIAKLVNELLSFSRASLAEPAKAQLRRVHVRALVENAVSREAGTARAEINCGEQLEVRADADLLDRGFSNLFRNAVRYAGDAGAIRVNATSANGEVIIAVEDSGPGIPEEALPQIFDPFFRVDTARTRETGGVGLGLTIAKSCIEACGGTITLRNLEPSGLAASIRLRAA